MTDDLNTLRARLQRLQALRDGGTLGDEAFAQGRQALEQSILDRVMAGAGSGVNAATPAEPAATPHNATPLPPSRRRAVGLLALCTLALLGAAGWAWWQHAPGADAAVASFAGKGSMGLPAMAASAAAPAASGAAHAIGPEQISAMAEKLAQRLKDKPDDAEGWAMLARSYATLGRHAQALPAYAKAVALRGDDAQLLADYADALAVQQGRLIDGEPLKLVMRALKADPDNLKALALAGTAAFAAQDYAGAVRHWERLARVGPKEHPLVQQIQVSIDEARTLGKLPGAPGAPGASGAAVAPVKTAKG